MSYAMEMFEINVSAIGGMSDEEFFLFCQENNHLRIERDADGKIIIMSPTGSKSGIYNSNLGFVLTRWNKQERKGYVFDSSAGFALPNGATRSPDVAFVLKEKWEVLTDEEQEGFAPLCPDFLIELKSKNDRLSLLQQKMEEYLDNGTALGWLIDPYEKKIYVYDQAIKDQPEKFEVFDDFAQPIRGKYFIEDFSMVPEEVLY